MRPPIALDVDTFIEAIEALGDGIAIYGPDEFPIFCNSAGRRGFESIYADMEAGLTYREALLKSIRRHLPQATAETVESIADRLVDSFHSGETYSAYSDDGRMMQVTFRNMSRGLKAAISVDVTDLRNREFELEARGQELDTARKAAEGANASKSAFLANMSHEIRTPLNGIMGLAQVLANAELDPQHREYVATILDSGKTLMALLNDVLDLSKIEAGKFDIVRSETSLTHLLSRQLKMWKPRAEEKGLEISLAFDADLPAHLSFDQVRVQQCVSNLISNAIKFTVHGRVQIFASSNEQAQGGYLVEIGVTDTGPGMDAPTLERLFQPFVQADASTQRNHGGTGLGLSIIKRLAELMGGTASATSEAGRGSTFRFSFKAGAAQASVAPVEARREVQEGDVRAQLKFSNLRILLVDDHPINRQVASLFLRPHKVHLVEATNGVEALAALEREPFDVVLLDVHMPIMDGPTTIRHIRASDKSWADIPVLALTADAMSGDRERYLAMGMTGYLPKPLSERDLVSEIIRVRGAGAATARIARAG